MDALGSKLLDYWRDLTGEPVDLAAHPSSSLPLHLRQRYDIRRGNFLGKDLLLALEQDPPESFSVGEYERHASVLQQKLGEGIVFVIPALPSSARTSMIRRRIPFVVPRSQTFLPAVWIDLRDRQPVPWHPPRRKFTPAAQCLLLFHLQCRPLSGIPLQEIAQTIGYSAIMITKVKAELGAAGICHAVKQGRSVVLDFNCSGKELWQRALPFLSAPDRSRHWVRWDHPARPALMAGLSALGKKTALSSDRIPTFALDHRKYLPLLENGILHGCRGQEEATVLIESWAYDPVLLSRGDCVDDLSLFLSLADSPDERIQQGLHQLLERVAW